MRAFSAEECPMPIAADCVARFHYVVREEGGAERESSAGADPRTDLHGHDGWLPGVAEALGGKAAGDKFSVTRAPDKAFGEKREDSELRVPISDLQGARKW